MSFWAVADDSDPRVSCRPALACTVPVGNHDAPLGVEPDQSADGFPVFYKKRVIPTVRVSRTLRARRP